MPEHSPDLPHTSAPDTVTLSDVVSRLHHAVRGSDRVSVGAVVDAMGRASLSALLLVPSLLLVSPISGVPGASVVGGTVIVLIAAQIVLRREKLWLPDVIRNRNLPGQALRRALVWLHRPAQQLDHLAPARPDPHPWWAPVLAVACLALGLAMPALELIPFTSSIVAALISVFALAMLTGRARVALIGVAVAAGAIGAVFWLL